MTDTEPDEQLDADRLAEHVRRAAAALRRPAAPTTPDAIPDRERDRSEARTLVLEQRWTRSLPAKFTGATLDDLAGLPGSEAIRRWALGREGTAPPWREGVNLVLLGAIGVGKSYASIAAARVPFEQGASCLYWSVPELLAALDWTEPEHRRVMRRAQFVDVLVLDDMGAEQPNDWTRRQLYELINRRWLDDRPTIASSNLPAGGDASAFEQAVGDRTYSRLVGGAISVRLGGNDRRRSHAPT